MQRKRRSASMRNVIKITITTVVKITISQMERRSCIMHQPKKWKKVTVLPLDSVYLCIIKIREQLAHSNLRALKLRKFLKNILIAEKQKILSMPLNYKNLIDDLFFILLSCE